jgi:hypothetical protein
MATTSGALADYHYFPIDLPNNLQREVPIVSTCAISDGSHLMSYNSILCPKTGYGYVST